MTERSSENGTILGIDCSSDDLAVALAEAGAVTAELRYLGPRAALRELVPTIDRTLSLRGRSIREVGGIGVTVGPGNWTGLRIGVETAKSVAQVLGVPVVGVPTLDVLAMNRMLTEPKVLAVLRSGRARSSALLFDCSAERPRRLTGPRVYSPEELQELARRAGFVLGDPDCLPSETLAANGGWLEAAPHLDRVAPGLVCRWAERELAAGTPPEPFDLVPEYFEGPGIHAAGAEA